jgi:predicted lipid-binding transport protein (Tim44 family)
MENLKQGLLGGTMMGLAAGGLIVLARAGQGVAYYAIVVVLVFILLLGLLLIVNSRAAGERVADADAAAKQPAIRTIAVADLKGALASGLADFMAMPTHLAFLCLIYPVVTFVAA